MQKVMDRVEELAEGILDTLEVTDVPQKIYEPCDSCGFRSVYFIHWTTGVTLNFLSFCGHHYRKNMPLMIAKYVGVNDG